MKKLVVMKFGGTSVEDAAAIHRTAGIVAGRRAKGLQPIVVVSAMAKVTDQLIAAANAAARGDRNGALAITARLRSRHKEVACRRRPAAKRLHTAMILPVPPMLLPRPGLTPSSMRWMRFCAGWQQLAN